MPELFNASLNEEVQVLYIHAVYRLLSGVSYHDRYNQLFHELGAFI